MLPETYESQNLHKQKKTEVDIFISKENFFFLCSPFLPHSKQIVLEQRALVSHLRELVAQFCFGNQNGRGNLCGFITGAFGVCAARSLSSCCPPRAHGPLLPSCVASGPGDFLACLSPDNSGIWNSVSITLEQPVPVLEPQASSSKPQDICVRVPRQHLSVLHPTGESTMRPCFGRRFCG